MIGKVKKNSGASGRALKVVYTGFSCESGEEKNVLYATDSKNCDCADGRLRCGLGETTFTDCSGGWNYASDGFTPFRIFLKPHKEEGAAAATFRLCVTTTTFVLMEYDTATMKYVRKFSFSKDVKPVVAIDEAENADVSVYGESGVWRYGGDGSSFLFPVRTDAGCNFAERNFYAVAPYRICFSAVRKPTAFEESANDSGWLELTENGGRVVAFAELGDELYVFREFGALQLSARSKASEFQVKTLPYCGGKIYGESVAACGDKIFFMAADGLWTFDGRAFVRAKVGERIRPLWNRPCFCAAYACGKYILQYTDDRGENCSITVAGDGESAYFGFYKGALSNSYGYALAYRENMITFVNENGFLPSGEKYYFKTECDLGKSGRKTLKQLTVVGRGTVQLSVSNGQRTESFSLELSQGAQTVRVDMKGGKFWLSFELAAGSEVCKVAADGYAL